MFIFGVGLAVWRWLQRDGSSAIKAAECIIRMGCGVSLRFGACSERNKKNESLRPRKCGRRQRLFKYYLLAIIHHELFNLFVDIYFVDFLGVTFVFERALAHTEDDLSTTVVENKEVVGNWVDAKTFDFTCTAEVGHFAEQFYSANPKYTPALNNFSYLR